jgi:hypothetical protein
MGLFGRSNRDRPSDQAEDTWLAAALRVREVDRSPYQFEPKPAEFVEAAQRNAEWTRPVEPVVRAAPAPVLDRAPSVPWSSEAPTQPGLYWWRMRGLERRLREIVQPKLAMVVLFGGTLSVRTRKGDSSAFVSVSALARDWAGPLPLPEDARLEDLEIG